MTSSLVLTPAELAAEASKFLLFGGGQALHFVDDRGHVTGEYLRNQAPPAGSQPHGDHPAIVAPSLPPDPAALFKVVDNHGDVAAGLEQFFADIALAQRADVEKRLQDAELAER
jgi:hypothetical protein